VWDTKKDRPVNATEKRVKRKTLRFKGLNIVGLMRGALLPPAALLPLLDFNEYFLGLGCGFHFLKQASESNSALSDEVDTFGIAHQYAPFCICRDIAGMYPDTFKIWHIQKKRKEFLKPLGKIDDNLILPRGNRGLALDLHRPHLVFQCVALELSID
jgi:hypothetical protein